MEDNLQASILNQRFDSKFQELRNTITREADCVEESQYRLAGAARSRLISDFLTALSERPLVAASGFRVAKNQSGDGCLR